MINKIINQLKSDNKIPEVLFNKYQFEIKNNKIFVMTNQAYQFSKIKPVRKGLLFAIIKGGKIELTDNAKAIIVNRR